MWRVSTVGVEASEVTVQELYLGSCAETFVDAPCARCGRMQSHREQQRLASLPNVLLVQVMRSDEGGSSEEDIAVLAEDQLAFPTLGSNLELASVLFSAARSVCACRCASGDFWWFDAVRGSQCLGASVSGVLKRRVSLLVYERGSGDVEFAMGARDADMAVASRVEPIVDEAFARASASVAPAGPKAAVTLSLIHISEPTRPY